MKFVTGAGPCAPTSLTRDRRARHAFPWPARQACVRCKPSDSSPQHNAVPRHPLPARPAGCYHPRMSRAPHASVRSAPSAAPPGLPTPLARPAWLDYLLILLGCALSLFLAELSGLRAARHAELPPALGPALLA